MPLGNYCKKCRVEVPNGETCPHCGARLTRAGTRLSCRMDRTPATDWFSWNEVLRVAVPVITLVLLASIAAEGVTEGVPGITNLFLQGFFGTLLTVMGAVLAATFLLFIAQGRETVRYVLDQKGAHVYVYLHKPKAVRLYARFTTPEAVGSLQSKNPIENGFTFIRETSIPWSEVKRAQFWPETATCLLYRPYWWQAMRVCCPLNEYPEMEAFIRTKIARNRRKKKHKK